MYSVVDNVAVLELYMKDTSSITKSRRYEEDARTMITFNKYLVDKKLAEWNEESYLSKVRSSCITFSLVYALWFERSCDTGCFID